MKKIFLLCLTVLLLITQTAAASPANDTENSLVSLRCSELKATKQHPSGVRIEIGLTNDKTFYEVSLDKDNDNRLFIKFADSRIKKLKRHVKMNNSLIRTIDLDREKKAVTVAIAAQTSLSDDKYRVFRLAADKAAKQPARLVVEIYNASADYYAPWLSGRTIVLDAGHGGSDPGAVGPSGIREKDVTFAVTNRLADMLAAAGSNVVLTRTSDTDVYAPGASGAQELQARVNVAENNRADVFVSIHANSFTSPSAHGTATYYYTGSTAGRQLAAELQNGMMRHIDLTDRGLEQANFYVLKRSSMPSALVELAFISNYTEEKLLADGSFQHRLAEGLFDGLAAYFK